LHLSITLLNYIVRTLKFCRSNQIDESVQAYVDLFNYNVLIKVVGYKMCHLRVFF
jgi:hypothetical protein